MISATDWRLSWDEEHRDPYGPMPFVDFIRLVQEDAHRAGFSAGLEAGAKLVDRWHIKKGGYGAQAEAIRALAAATGEGK